MKILYTYFRKIQWRGGKKDKIFKKYKKKAKNLGVGPCKKMKIGIVEENKKLRKWYEAHGFIHTHAEKFDFFPFTCGYMERELS